MPNTWDADERSLQRAAAALRQQLNLDAAVQAIGEPTLVGSAALRLLVARDLDITVTVPRLDRATIESIAHLGGTFMMRSDVNEVVLRDDTGRWNTDPRYPDGIYLRVTCVDASDEQWTVDLWFVDEPDRQPDLEHVRELSPRITPAIQADILRIKRAQTWRRRDGSRLPSFEIYRAVLDGGVTDAEGYRAHLAKHHLI